MKIAKKHFLLTGTIIFVVVTSVLMTLYFVMPLYYEQVKIREIDYEFKQLTEQIAYKSTTDIKKILTKYSQTHNRLWLSLLNAEGTILYPEIVTDEDKELQLSVIPTHVDASNQIKHVSRDIINSEGEILTLHGDYSLQSIEDASTVLLQLYPYILFFTLAIGGAVAYIYSRFATMRITVISESTRKMANLSPDAICDVQGNDEITYLAQDINHLYAHLLHSIEALRLENEKAAESEREKAEFLRMTSHELKTPITSMMGIVDGMIYNVGEFKDRDTYLHKCREILEEQSQLVHLILDISKLEMKMEDVNDTFSLTELLKENLAIYQMLADIKHFTFITELKEVEITGNKVYLLKAIKNLLDNAFHYTVSQGQIALSLTKECLIIENQAEQMLDEKQIEHIFKPFYRPDYSRNRKDGGTGLGLFIVQQILEKHQYSYRFEAVDQRFMRFTIFFDKKEKDKL